MTENLSYLDPWKNGTVQPGYVVKLQFFHNENFDPCSKDICPYIVSNEENKRYSLVSLQDGEVIASSDSIGKLREKAEVCCDSQIKFLNMWNNVEDCVYEEGYKNEN